MNYIVFDLEWNQSNTGKEPECGILPFEVIEIGAVKLNNDLESIGKFRHAGNAMRMAAHYPVSIYPFRDGVAYVSWTLYPDGMYFMDEDGFGMECCDEETVGAYNDTDCNILVKFQDMEESTKRKRLYEEALLMERKSKKDKV